MSPFLFIEVIHAAHILVRYLAGKFQFVLEPIDCLFIGSDLRLQDFECHFLVDFRILNPEDFSHPPFAQFFDDLVPGGKNSAPRQISRACIRLLFRGRRRVIRGR